MAYVRSDQRGRNGVGAPGQRSAGCACPLNHRMHCVGCAIAPFETLAEVCCVYGVPLKRLLSDLDAATKAERNDNT